MPVKASAVLFKLLEVHCTRQHCLRGELLWVDLGNIREELSRNNKPLDLRRSFVDLVDLCVTHQLFHGVFGIKAWNKQSYFQNIGLPLLVQQSYRFRQRLGLRQKQFYWQRRQQKPLPWRHSTCCVGLGQFRRPTYTSTGVLLLLASPERRCEPRIYSVYCVLCMCGH